MLRAAARRTVLVGLLVVATAAPATATAAVGPLTLVSGASPFVEGCEGAPQTGTVFRNAEVEPWVDVNLADDEQPRRQLAAGPLVERRREREPECLLAQRGHDVDDPADQRGV